MDATLLSIIVCPTCKGELTHIQEEKEGLYCTQCGVYYPIIEDIPVLLKKEGMNEDAWNVYKKKEDGTLAGKCEDVE